MRACSSQTSGDEERSPARVAFQDDLLGTARDRIQRIYRRPDERLVPRDAMMVNRIFGDVMSPPMELLRRSAPWCRTPQSCRFEPQM